MSPALPFWALLALITFSSLDARRRSGTLLFAICHRPFASPHALRVSTCPSRLHMPFASPHACCGCMSHPAPVFFLACVRYELLPILPYPLMSSC
ncbi:hypothetical protein BU25DRAFT_218637 [Macroventuria anomochaeta]|uniref:Uncharacterized protein n=1 Tax=Macroventuria anomochaeta TaxID=301207 RepID=A0ACB6RJK0_9PLEO|nr:uncharacterized protein BU25DRAFT_218637 [Macroventuria anomochaeta]KAF2622076.1 hypothetical protein BU25DRAFT_218637 [Macroventuria anomochaeta]